MKKRSSNFNTRQYMLAEDYEIFYYSDLQFKSVGNHSHSYYEFYFFEEGAVRMEIYGESVVLRQGDMLLVPPGIPHRAQILDPEVPYRRFVFWISPAFLEKLKAQAPEYALPAEMAEEGRFLCHFDLLDFNAVRTCLFSLLEEMHTNRYGHEEQLNLDVRCLLLLLGRLLSEQEENTSPEGRSAYEAISGYIDTHLGDSLTLSVIAGELYLSKYYIAHLFREETGMAVHQYITKKRLAACCSAIQSGTPIGEVCTVFGFQDYSSFYRAFHKEYGMSPSEYRAVSRQAPGPVIQP